MEDKKVRKLKSLYDVSVRENYMITMGHREKLINLAETTGKTKSELIREGIDMLADKYEPELEKAE